MKWDGPMDWTDLAQYVARWLALVNAVTKSEFYKMRWSCCVAKKLPKKERAPWIFSQLQLCITLSLKLNLIIKPY